MKRKTTYLAVAWVLASVAVVETGAADLAPAAAPAKAWSAYAPVTAPAEPVVKQKGWAHNPIDNFILAQLEAQGLKPSPEADRATYIRRATLDAWGVIPTPEEVKAFVNDRAPNAYEKLVDRLLASPHYGERQARRWLDLARYADSSGFQNDQTRPNNWRYRDYVINAFNQDKPYSRFLQEQLAGDEIWPDSQEAKVATGFLAGYPDNSNSRDLIQRKYQITTDIVDTIGEAVLASTLGCARCHNHKSDKVSQKEYFQLQAYFANTSFDDKAQAAKGPQELAFDQAQTSYREATKDLREKRRAIIDSVRAKGEKYHKERYLTDSRESIFKPQAEWNALDRWVNNRYKNVTTDADVANYLKLTSEDKAAPDFNPDHVEKYKEYQRLGVELAKFDKLRPGAGSSALTTATELGHNDAPPTHVRFGGIHERPLEVVQPGLPTLFAGAGNEFPSIAPSATSSGRRTALANWISSPSNPLTARVFVNRVWAQFFNTGIIGTVSDFGRAGQKPTNPALLDYLAANFVKDGWSVKKLQRQILLSSVYRQSSAHRADALKADPDNKLLAVFPRKRLEAEEIRDSLLVASGQINDKIGGPSVLPPVPANLNAGRAWEVTKDTSEHNRRSVYVFVRRSVPYPMLESFDMANPQQVHSKRSVTTTPLQALTLFNSEIVLGWSQALAGKVLSENGGNESAQFKQLYLTLFSREPNQRETAALKEFLNKQEKIIGQNATSGKFAIAVPTGLKENQRINPLRAAAFVDLVHTVANSNDFAYRF